jgi:uncharacterized protein
MGSYCPHSSMFSRCLPLSSSARTVIFRSATNLKARTGADVDMNILASHGPRVNVTHIRRGGFQIDGHIVNGSVALFKGMFLKWNVKSMEEITEESLSLFRILNPNLEILVIGTGDSSQRVSPNIMKHLKQHGILVEALPSAKACATYNFLEEEGRVAAAALLPPFKI